MRNPNQQKSLKEESIAIPKFPFSKKSLKAIIKTPECPICNQKFSANKRWRTDIRNHIKYLHKEVDLFSIQKIDSVSNDEMKKHDVSEKYENVIIPAVVPAIPPHMIMAPIL